MNRATCNAGFSLVEILVGMVIGLLGVIIIMQIFAIAEGQKRTTTSGADAQTNGNIALYTIERDTRLAGYGMSLTGLVGCVIPATVGNLTLTPVIINDGGVDGAGNALPDQLRVFYSNNTMTGMPITPVPGVPANYTSTTATIASTLAVAVNDMIVIFEAGPKCTLVKVTGVIDNQNITIDSANWSTVWPGYSAAATVYNFGSMVNRLYNIDALNNNLQVLDVSVNGVTNVPIAGEIVNIQAQYGKDNGVNNATAPGPYTANDGKVDSWDTCAPGSVACATDTWAQVIAVRIAILARSGQYEKPTTAGVCTATTAAPTWTGGSMAIQSAGGGLPSCYRYKVFETVVPLRNVIWG